MAWHISLQNVTGAPKLRVTAIPFLVDSISSSAPAQVGDPAQLVEPAATRHNHQRPRTVRVEGGEIGAVWTPILESFAADAAPIPQTSSTGTVESNSAGTPHLTGAKIAEATILRTPLCDELGNFDERLYGGDPHAGWISPSVERARAAPARAAPLLFRGTRPALGVFHQSSRSR